MLFVSLSASAVHADGFGIEHYESPLVRARGGADVASGVDSPANAALDHDKQIELLRIDARATLSDGIHGVRAAYQLQNLDLSSSGDPMEELKRLSSQIDDARKTAGGNHLNVAMRARLDLASLHIDGAWGQLQLGAYAWSSTIGVADLPNEMRASNMHVDAEGPYLDLGRRRRLVSARGIAETGLRTGYGRAHSLKGGSRLAWGAALRGFALARAEPHELWAESTVRGMEDLERPSRFDCRRGYGLGLDLYGAWELDDAWLGSRLAARVEDAGSYVVVAGETDLRMPRVGLGGQLLPFKALGDERTRLSVDLERVEQLAPALQIGIDRPTGWSWLAVDPSVGVALFERDLFGSQVGPRGTSGLGLTLGAVKLAGSVEYNFRTKALDAGVTVALAH